MTDNSEPDDEPEFEPDQDGEPWPLAVLWERDQVDVHPGFRDALDSMSLSPSHLLIPNGLHRPTRRG